MGQVEAIETPLPGREGGSDKVPRCRKVCANNREEMDEIQGLPAEFRVLPVHYMDRQRVRAGEDGPFRARSYRRFRRSYIDPPAISQYGQTLLVCEDPRQQQQNSPCSLRHLQLIGSA